MKTQIAIAILAFLALASAQTTEEPKPSPTPDPDFKCPDLNDTMIPDPDDCSDYYECTNGLAWHFSCPDTLLYHDQLKQCRWPQEVDCGDRPLPPTESPLELFGQEIIGPAPDYNCTENGAHPHELYCEYYYDCWEGSASLGRCTEYMLFDTFYRGCNYPHQVFCNGLLRPNGTGEEPTTQEPPHTGPTDEPEFRCPEPDGLFPHPDDCSYFYQCVNGIPFRNVCPVNLVFNPDTNQCDYLANVPSCQDQEWLD